MHFNLAKSTRKLQANCTLWKTEYREIEYTTSHVVWHQVHILRSKNPAHSDRAVAGRPRGRMAEAMPARYTLQRLLYNIQCSLFRNWDTSFACRPCSSSEIPDQSSVEASARDKAEWMGRSVRCPFVCPAPPSERLRTARLSDSRTKHERSAAFANTWSSSGRTESGSCSRAGERVCSQPIWFSHHMQPTHVRKWRMSLVLAAAHHSNVARVKVTIFNPRLAQMNEFNSGVHLPI